MAGRAERAVARRAGATMVVLALTGAVGAAAPPAAAAGWTVVLGATSSGGAMGGTAPVPPAGVTASCSSLLSGAAQVEWDGVPGATSFGIYESTQSATAGYALVATGVTGTSWTSPTLGTGTYWFEVASFVGTDWVGPPSPATGALTITLSLLCV